jgi:hypothetical protein
MNSVDWTETLPGCEQAKARIIHVREQTFGVSLRNMIVAAAQTF